MFGLIKKHFFTAITFFSYNTLNVNSLECVPMSNQECKIRSEIINVNTNEPMFYPYSITMNKCKGICNTINDPYVKLCVPDTIIKSILSITMIKVFNLMARTNETKHIELHKTFKCTCILDASVCKNKQRWSEDKCRCECKELIDKEMCDKGFIWNPSNCEYECNKLCNVGEYLDYKNCKCRKSRIDKLIEESSKNIYENETLDIIPLHSISLNFYKKVCSFRMAYIVLFLYF